MMIMFWNFLTPKFYIALTATSFFISIGILTFEYWYFSRFGMSFLEFITTNFIYPVFGNPNLPENGIEEDGLTANSIENNHKHLNPLQIHHRSAIDCNNVVRNPMGLLRGAEYNLFMQTTSKEPLTFYDMNLSAQDHQTYFTCETDVGREDMEIMQTAWRERDPEARIKSAQEAIAKNVDCAPAYILLAEEKAKNVVEAEKILKEGLRAAETLYRKSLQTHQLSLQLENQFKRDQTLYIYIRRRLAMCARKMGKLKESIKIMRDLMKEFSPNTNLFNIQENLIEALLEVQAYADVQAVLAKCDEGNSSRSTTILYTSALLKARNIGEKFSPELIAKRGLSVAEMHAVEAIHRAVEWNPHVPKYLLETKKLIFPTEHVLKRGDSDAISYAFFHLAHWKRVDGALNLLDCTWKGTFRILPNPNEKGHLFPPYAECTECTDRELLPDWHNLSVYPKKDLPFFIRFTASLCTMTALMVFITYQYPELMLYLVRSTLNYTHECMTNVVEKIELILPSWAWQISWRY